MHHARTAVLGLLFFIPACGFSEPVGEAERVQDSGLSRQTFIEAYVALRQAERDAPTPQEFEARKRTALARLGVTPEELLRFAEVHGQDIRYMSEVWDSVEARLAAQPPDSART
ncbi:MAG: hypothetical protein HY561_07345 [Gemmatimonadetes bacterium]|nr:hypothetical protein [Gemmatimonadota bacterium]